MPSVDGAQYAALSQLAHHNLPPSALVTLEPPSEDSYLPTSHILSTISEHAAETALVLLPGIQYYNGQYFDIPLITRHCHSLGVVVGWDLAHAVGNVPLALHDWDVDFAAWCNYKYMNGGPGVIGGAFVHARHGTVVEHADAAQPHGELVYRPRLSGWWGSDKASRFAMANRFVPMAGASGFQLSNPSALDMTAVMASLDVFARTSLAALRAKSVRLTAYLEALLAAANAPLRDRCLYSLITPSAPSERGAQLSVRLAAGMLGPVMDILEREGVVVDERQPDVVRVAPAPLYNSYEDVWRFAHVFSRACRDVAANLWEDDNKGK